MRQLAVYILASGLEGTLYVGVTSDLVRRVWEHRSGVTGGFAGKYGCTLLVYFELHSDMAAAIGREKQIKGGARKRKVALIEAGNPIWRDLYPEVL